MRATLSIGTEAGSHLTSARSPMYKSASLFPRGGSSLPNVVTVLTPPERIRVEAAGEGLFHSTHRDSVDDAIRDVRAARADAIVLSVSYCERTPTEPVASMVREFPRVPTLALLSNFGPRTPQTILSLGTSGIRSLIDVREAGGWRSLRANITHECGNPVQRLALHRLADDLRAAPPDCWAFFQAIFLCPSYVTSVRKLSEVLGVLPSTLMSRFFRSKLPAPKRYLSMARLVRAAHLFENRGFSVANIANHLDYSSPQSFGRHVRALLGLSALEFRERFDGEGMFERFRSDLVLPHLDKLRRLTPLRAAVPAPRGRNSGGVLRAS